MILFKCDRCGQVISPYVHKIAIEAYVNTDYATNDPVNSPWGHEIDPGYIKDELAEKVYGIHLCRTCVEQIATVILDRNFEGGVPATYSVGPAQEPDPQPEPAEKLRTEPAAEQVDADPDDSELTEEEEQKICDRIAGAAKNEKRKIDLGKLKTLWEANQRGADWPITKIADELGCSGATVHYHLKKMRLK